MRTIPTFCRICEASCGLLADVEDNRVLALRPDPDHVSSKGFVCIKGVRYVDVHASPDRVKTPLRRVPGTERFEPVSWETALREIGERTRAIREQHGPHAVGTFLGNPAAFSIAHAMFAAAFTKGLGTRNAYGSSTQDCSNKFAVANEVYGFPFTQPFPDVERIKHLIIVGANPVVSKWSFVQVPNPQAHIKAIQARGGKVVVVDPRRTETAKVASEHVFIRPGTDVFFYLAFLHEVLRRGAVDEAKVAAYMRGLDDVEALVEAWSPERCAGATGVQQGVLRRLVDEYLEADGAALYCSTGVNMGGEGALAFWLQEVINAITGNLDRPGGTLVGNGVIDFPAFILIDEATNNTVGAGMIV